MKDELTCDSLIRDANGETQEILQDDADMLEDRFRVDRKKLEQMLQPGADGETGLAETFFDQVMRQTDTIITWPLKLKIGAKSKKDPHVKIKGTKENIENAKGIILQTFDTKTGQVSLKIDVPFDEHSFIIGKGGSGSKEVALASKAQIHFPDVNRSATSKKSNQVSLRGLVENVEMARQQLRGRMSLTLQFVIPSEMLPTFLKRADLVPKDTRIVRFMPPCMEQDSNVRICLKGREENAEEIKLCTKKVLKCMPELEYMVNTIYNTLEILHDNQMFVRGVRNCNVVHIETVTGASIKFPPPLGTLATQFHNRIMGYRGNMGMPIGDSHMMSSTVEISGPTLDCVYEARKMLMGFLPVSLVFDISQTCDVTDTMDRIPQCVEKNSKVNEAKGLNSINLKTSENQISLLYEAHGLFMNKVPARKPSLVPVIESNLVSTQLQDHGQVFANFQFTDLLNYPGGLLINNGSSALSSNTSSLSTPGHSPERGSPIERYVNVLANGFDNINLMDHEDLLPFPLRRSSTPDSPPRTQPKTPQDDTPKFAPYHSMWREAGEAMYHVYNGPEIRIPNNRFAGDGYSCSMPQSILHQLNDCSPKDPWSDTASKIGINPGASNRFEGISMKARDGLRIEDCTTIWQLLHVIKLEKYMSVFQSHDIDLDAFLMLKTEHLLELKIDLSGRLKLEAVIKEMNRKTCRDFCAAPGAERKVSRPTF